MATAHHNDIKFYIVLHRSRLHSKASYNIRRARNRLFADTEGRKDSAQNRLGIDMACQSPEFTARETDIFGDELCADTALQMFERCLEMRQSTLNALAVTRAGDDRCGDVLGQLSQSFSDGGFNPIDAHSILC